MKILQVVSSWKGGVIKVAFDVSRMLRELRHEVTIYITNLAFGNSNLDKKGDVKILSFNSLCSQIAKRVKVYITPRLIPRAREVRNFDIVHIHGYRTFQNGVIYYFVKKYEVPYILQAHGSLPRIMAKQSLKWLYDVLFGYRLLRDAAKVIALSRVEAEQYRSMGIPEEKIAIIPNGIDLSEYAELPPKGVFKKKFNIPEDRKIILYLGRIHRIKGIDFLVRAYAYLIKKTDLKDCILVIAGPDDGYMDKAIRLVNNLKIIGSVLFTGMLTEKEKVSAYVDSSIVVNVEPRNVFGLVPLEAAACSTPVIVSKDNAISEVICEGKFGFSIRYGDDIALAKTMEAILKDEEFANEMGKRGREYIFAKFDWSKMVAKLEKVYEEVSRR